MPRLLYKELYGSLKRYSMKEEKSIHIPFTSMKTPLLLLMMNMVTRKEGITHTMGTPLQQLVMVKRCI